MRLSSPTLNQIAHHLTPEVICEPGAAVLGEPGVGFRLPVGAVYIFIFFVAGSATYKSPCRSVTLCVRPSVTHSFFCIFGQFKGGKVSV